MYMTIKQPLYQSQIGQYCDHCDHNIEKHPGDKFQSLQTLGNSWLATFSHPVPSVNSVSALAKMATGDTLHLTTALCTLPYCSCSELCPTHETGISMETRDT